MKKLVIGTIMGLYGCTINSDPFIGNCYQAEAFGMQQEYIEVLSKKDSNYQLYYVLSGTVNEEGIVTVSEAKVKEITVTHLQIKCTISRKGNK